LFEFAVVRLMAVDDFGTGTAFLLPEERDSKSNLNAVSSVSSHILRINLQGMTDTAGRDG
jgi:hypothetical protein